MIVLTYPAKTPVLNDLVNCAPPAYPRVLFMVWVFRGDMVDCGEILWVILSATKMRVKREHLWG